MRFARESAGYGSMKEFATLLGADRGTLGAYERTGLAKKAIVEAYAKHTGFRYEWIELGEGLPTEETPHPGGPGEGLNAGSKSPAGETSLYHLRPRHTSSAPNFERWAA